MCSLSQQITPLHTEVESNVKPSVQQLCPNWVTQEQQINNRMSVKEKNQVNAGAQSTCRRKPDETRAVHKQMPTNFNEILTL